MCVYQNNTSDKWDIPWYNTRKQCITSICILSTWQKNMCILPEDLKNFFLTTNGLLIQWSIKFDGNFKLRFPNWNKQIKSELVMLIYIASKSVQVTTTVSADPYKEEHFASWPVLYSE